MAKLKILAIEDDEAIVKLYELALTADIFELKTVLNGKEGLESYKSWQPDIILLDIMLPVTTGYASLQEIRHDMADADTTIIMATSLNKKEDIIDCMKFGIQGYLVKPFDHKNIVIDILNGYGKLHPGEAEKAILEYKEFLLSQNKDKDSEGSPDK